MRNMRMLLLSGMVAASLLAGCDDDDDDTTAPTTPPVTPPTTPPTTPGSPAPSTAGVTVGDIFFTSLRNGSSNPAVDTVAANGTVTWTWGTTEVLPHSVQSVGSPSFTSSEIMTGAGSTYSFTFTTPGTYQYDCAVHGQMMTGTIVVLADTTTTDTTTTDTTTTDTTTTDTTTTPTPAPVTASVSVGDIFFMSALNGSSNPAVDTVGTNGTVTWTWAATATLPHSVQSLGFPGFTSSGIQTGPGSTYSFTFTTPGTYQYDCAVHGSMMTGTVVVLADTAASSTPPPLPPGY